MKVYYDKDADLSLIKGKKVAIIGYGSQGHAHAQNLKDSGGDVVVGLRKGGASWDKVGKAGLQVAEVGDAVKGADFVMMLLPDEHIAQVYRDEVEPEIKEGATLAFAHGFNVHYGQVMPRADLDVVMVAPKAPGPHGARHVRAGRRRADADRGPSGHVGPRARHRAVVRRGDRRRPRRRHRDELPRGDRDRPVRRADGAVRRRGRADQGRLRDAGRGRLRAGDGVLRVPARAQADRRPDLRGRHREHELRHLEQRRVRRVRHRSEDRDRRDEAGDAPVPEGHPDAASTRRASSWRAAPADRRCCRGDG